MSTTAGLPYFGYSNLVERFEERGHQYEKRRVLDPKNLELIRDPRTGKDIVVFFNTNAFSPTKSRAE